MTRVVQAYKALSACKILSNERSHKGLQTGSYIDLGISEIRMGAKQGRPGLKSSESGMCSWGVHFWLIRWRSGHIITVSRSSTCSIVPPPPLAEGPRVLVWLFWRWDTMTVQTVNLPCSSSAHPAAASLVFTRLKIFLINRNLMQQIILFFHCECLYHVISHYNDVLSQASIKE